MDEKKENEVKKTISDFCGGLLLIIAIISCALWLGGCEHKNEKRIIKGNFALEFEDAYVNKYGTSYIKLKNIGDDLKGDVKITFKSYGTNNTKETTREFSRWDKYEIKVLAFGNSAFVPKANTVNITIHINGIKVFEKTMSLFW